MLDLAATRLEMRWLPVTDPTGRTRMEASWVCVGDAAAPGVGERVPAAAAPAVHHAA